MRRREFISAAFALAISSRRGWGAPLNAAKSILDYGAKPGGKKLSTEAIQRAIAEASRSGGGTVLIPSGIFLSGRIELLSGVTLYLDAGATLVGSKSISDYEGSGGGRHLIFAANAGDVGIAGTGRIDGQGPSFWEPSGQAPKPPDERWRAVASHKLKPKKSGHPSPMIYFMNCQGVQVQDVRIVDSPGWTLHAFNCDNVNIHGIAIKNPIEGPNTDGIDLTGCQNVTVSNCSVETGDDAICLKTKNPYGSEPRLVRNVKVTDCSLSTCCNGFKIGTESEGGFENITFSNSRVYSGDVAYENRVISGVALEVVDGGWIEGVEIKGIQMQRARAPIFVRLGNRKSPQTYAQHGLSHVRFEDIQATDTLIASCITGLPGMEAEDVTLSNVHAGNSFPYRKGWTQQPVPEKPNSYPEVWMFGMLPATGIYARHVRGLRLDNADFSAVDGETRPTVVFDDVSNTQIVSLASTPVGGPMPVIQLIECGDVEILDSAAPTGTNVYLGVDGSNSSGIVLSGDNLHDAQRAVETSDGASPGAVTTREDSSAPQ
jgi:Glycosyl hydrolases family 28